MAKKKRAPEKAERKKLDTNRLLIRIVELMARHDPRELTFSRVSRHCNVPRSTLYYYFGKDSEQMLAEAAKHGLKLFFSVFLLEPAPQTMSWDKYQDMIFRNTVEIVCRYPWAPQVYFRYLKDPGPVGASVRKLQNDYFVTFSQRWKEIHGHAPNALAVKILGSIKMGLLFGVAVEPDIKAGKEQVVALIKKLSMDLLKA